MTCLNLTSCASGTVLALLTLPQLRRDQPLLEPGQVVVVIPCAGRQDLLSPDAADIEYASWMPDPGAIEVASWAIQMRSSVSGGTA